MVIVSCDHDDGDDDDVGGGDRALCMEHFIYCIIIASHHQHPSGTEASSSHPSLGHQCSQVSRYASILWDSGGSSMIVVVHIMPIHNTVL